MSAARVRAGLTATGLAAASALAALVIGLLAAVTPAVADDPASSAALPEGFHDDLMISGLDAPTVFRFAPDGSIFVAEKSGVIKVFDDLDDTTPTINTGLHVNVHNFMDRGLLGMALDPAYPAAPYVYVLYAFDHEPNTPLSEVPAWGNGIQHYDASCPASPSGGTEPECPSTGRLSRLTVDPATGVIDPASEDPIIEDDWCFQFTSHGTGALEFGPDGYLYASAGEGATYESADAGVSGSCGDPIGEGGALRSQDLLTMGDLANDPLGLNGALIRVDKTTGEGAPSNPLAGHADTNARRILAHGFRNPFRFTVRPAQGAPGQVEVAILDVGWSTFEEINMVRAASGGAAPLATDVPNFGWPCYEGNARTPEWDTANVPLCESLYAADTVIDPFFHYEHGVPATNGDTCSTVYGSSLSAVGFIPGDSAWPDTYDGSMLFGDFARRCLWNVPAEPDGSLRNWEVSTFHSSAGTPVMIQVGPDGQVYYLEIFDSEDRGNLRRIGWFDGDQPPTAAVSVDRTWGPVPLTVQFDGSGSTGDAVAPLEHAWDLDGDGVFDDATGAVATSTYVDAANVTVGLKVTDGTGQTDVEKVLLWPGNTPPVAEIGNLPTLALPGDVIDFAGTGTDVEDGSLTGESLEWRLNYRHCPSTDCHTHPAGTWTGSGGTFTVLDHDRPTHLELTLRVTDSRGQSTSTTARIDYGEAPTPTPTSTPTPTPTPTSTPTPPGTLSPSPTQAPTPGPTHGPVIETQRVRIVFKALARKRQGKGQRKGWSGRPRLRFKVDGRWVRGKVGRTFEAGDRIVLVAPRRQRAAGRVWRFHNWSDRGARRHVLTVPERGGRIVVRFR